MRDVVCRQARRILNPYGETPRHLWRRGLVVLLACAALLSSLQALWAGTLVACSRVFEPYPIAWLEPLFLRSALQVSRGLPLYGPPSPTYIAPIYNPGYPFVGGTLFGVFGPGYPVLRVFSTVMAVGLLLLLWQWVRRETRDELWAVVTAVVMLAVSEPLHNWLTHCNIDAPFLLFGMLGFYLLRFHPGQRPAVVAAALSMALSFLFKQHGLLLAASALLYLVTVDRSLAAVFASVLSVFAGLLVLMLVVRSGGWYWTAAVEIPLHSIWKEHPRFLQDLFRSPALGILALVFLAGGTAVLFRLNEGKGRLFAALFGAALVVSFLGYQKQGGARNSLLPIYVVGTLALGMAPSALQGVRPRRLCRHAVKAALLVIALVVLHLGFVGARKRAADAGWTAPWSSSRTPTYRSYSRFERRIEAAVRSLPGEVFVGARFLALEDQGRPLNFHQTALYEGTVRTSEYDVDEIIGADLAAHRYRAMIVWAYREKPFRALLERYYRKGKKLGRDPFLGMDVHVWTPR